MIDSEAQIDFDGKGEDVKNKNSISECNVRLSKYTKGIKNFWQQITKFEDKLIRPWQPGGVPLRRGAVALMPRKWDWRDVANRNWVTPIKSQGVCGACVAFAVTAAVESHLMIERNDPNLSFDLSEASLFYTANRQCDENDPAYGWFIQDALNFLMEEGICFEENFPFEDVNQITKFKTGTNRVYRITGYDITSNPLQMKCWLVEKGPLITMFSVYNNFYRFWNEGARGVYRFEEGMVLGNHAVLVVGFDDKEGCWICKNSHPVSHGNNGFFKIAYHTAGIDNQMYLIKDVYPVDLREEYSYDPNTLNVVDSGSLGWRLIDGKRTIKYLDNYNDALNALHIARKYTIHGAIGTKNRRRCHLDYVIEYWRGESGLDSSSLSQTDYISYNPKKIQAVDRDELGWEFCLGKRFKLMADDMNDALATLKLIQRHNRICFIGRKNSRVNPKKYIMIYWE